MISPRFQTYAIDTLRSTKDELQYGMSFEIVFNCMLNMGLRKLAILDPVLLYSIVFSIMLNLIKSAG